MLVTRAVFEFCQSLDNFSLEICDSDGDMIMDHSSEHDDDDDEDDDYTTSTGSDEAMSGTPGDHLQTDASPGQKVFAIPELFESIMLSYAARNTQIEESHKSLKCPVPALYAIQRVNKSCRDNTIGSKELRRLMFLLPPKRGTDEEKSLRSNDVLLNKFNLQPLWWLFRTFGAHGQKDYPIALMTANDIHLDDIEVSQPSPDAPPTVRNLTTVRQMGTNIFRSSMIGMRREEASWRRMKVFRVPERGSITICQLFRFPDSHSCYRIEFTIDQDTTLGEFWDWYQRSCVLSYDDHRDAMMGIAACRSNSDFRLLG